MMLTHAPRNRTIIFFSFSYVCGVGLSVIAVEQLPTHRAAFLILTDTGSQNERQTYQQDVQQHPQERVKKSSLMNK